MLQNVQELPAQGNVEPIFDRAKYVDARTKVQRLIDRAARSDQPIIEIVTITPEIAGVLLSRNPEDENRRLAPKTVARYAKDMASGRWQGLNGQTIVVSSDGYLNDGQHRLSAVIKADAAIPFAVVFGAERISRLTLDQNKTRTSGQYLQMLGVPDANNVSAVAKMLMAYDAGVLVGDKSTPYRSVKSENSPTKAELHEYAVDHQQAITKSLHMAERGDASILAPKSRIAACHRIISRKANSANVERFFVQLLYGEDLKRGMPALTARRRLIADRPNRPPVFVTFETVLRAWNAFARGDDMKLMSLRGKLPKVEG